MQITEILERCKQNDRRAQMQLYNKYSEGMYYVAFRFLKNSFEAEEAMQEGFVKAFTKMHQYNGEVTFGAWLKRIVINTALQRYRKQQVFEIVNEQQIEQEEVTVDTEDISLQFLLKIVQELPDRYRLVFNLYVLDGYPHKEIAKMLSISEGTSKSNLARARLILKEKVENFQQSETLQSSTR